MKGSDDISQRELLLTLIITILSLDKTSSVISTNPRAPAALFYYDLETGLISIFIEKKKNK